MVQVTKQLLEENERLRERLHIMENQKCSERQISDLLYVSIGSVIYFLVVGFVMAYAWVGIVYNIYMNPDVDVAILIWVYLLCKVLLYGTGIFVAAVMVFGIFRENILDFIYRFSCAVARNIEETCDDYDVFESIDEEVVRSIEREIKRDTEKEQKSSSQNKRKKPTATPPRGKHGEFISTKKKQEEKSTSKDSK